MPELPDITVYIERLESFASGKVLLQVRLLSPFVLRTALPPIEEIFGKEVTGFRRLGKRIVFKFADDYYLVLHLMVLGRLFWKKKGCAIPRGRGLAAFDFSHGSLLFTEAGTRKKASMHLVKGKERLGSFNTRGLEILEAPLEAFGQRLLSENHTLKRALTDPWLFSGIGNTYSDEILFAARLSPVLQTRKMSDGQVRALYNAAQTTLAAWTGRLRGETGDGFPEKVTAVRPDMAVHGRFGKPCAVCGTAIQRIVYAENETNYCPRCQTGGRLLADRALSKLLHKDWPRTVEELEARHGRE
ncbi:MAG: formamidopyrimidine-DNA glycosylase [Chitinivibrionales bacterium]|nr:formamidopyrimidine-DNA glycosylase [Chitinivibrionales bacterium]MBD3394007.1 formamidopyrimidine-DNA glycosylase [Chitinivibrionales bacterium]